MDCPMESEVNECATVAWVIKPTEMLLDDDGVEVVYERIDTSLYTNPACNASAVCAGANRAIVSTEEDNGNLKIGVPAPYDKRLVEGAVGSDVESDFGVRVFSLLLHAITEESHAKPLRAYLTTRDGSTVMWNVDAIPIVIAIMKGSRTSDRSTIGELLSLSRAAWAADIQDGTLPATCPAMREICTDTQTYTALVALPDGKRRAKDAWGPCIGGRPPRNVESTRLTAHTQFKAFVNGRAAIRGAQRLQSQGYSASSAAALTGMTQGVTAAPSEGSGSAGTPTVGILPRRGRFN